jgi:hypothetical protein
MARGLPVRVLVLGSFMATAALVYFGAAFLFGGFRWGDLKGQLRRRRA